MFRVSIIVVLLMAIVTTIYLPTVINNGVSGAGGAGTATPTRVPSLEDATTALPDGLSVCPDDPMTTPVPPGGCRLESAIPTAGPNDMPASIPYPSRLLQLTATAEAQEGSPP